MSNSARFVLDSFALLAYFQDEPGGARVQGLLAQAEKKEAELWLCIINYGEVVYIVQRDLGLTAVQTTIGAIDQLPITVVDADRALTFAAAHLKAQYPIAYADAFALALAQSRQATLLTGDPEFHKVESQAKVEWLVQK